MRNSAKRKMFTWIFTVMISWTGLCAILFLCGSIVLADSVAISYARTLGADIPDGFSAIIMGVIPLFVWLLLVYTVTSVKLINWFYGWLEKVYPEEKEKKGRRFTRPKRKQFGGLIR